MDKNILNDDESGQIIKNASIVKANGYGSFKVTFQDKRIVGVELTLQEDRKQLQNMYQKENKLNG
jgi:hypothetical protein